MVKLRLGVMHKTILPHFVLRRTKKLIAEEVRLRVRVQAEVLQLPSKRDLIVFCPLASRQIEAYQAFIQSEDVVFVVRRDELCDCGSEEKWVPCLDQD